LIAATGCGSGATRSKAADTGAPARRRQQQEPDRVHAAPPRRMEQDAKRYRRRQAETHRRQVARQTERCRKIRQAELITVGTRAKNKSASL